MSNPNKLTVVSNVYSPFKSDSFNLVTMGPKAMCSLFAVYLKFYFLLELLRKETTGKLLAEATKLGG